MLLFSICVLGIFSTAAFYVELLSISIGVSFAVFCASALLYESRYSDLPSLNTYQGKAITGMIYIGLLPGLAYQLLALEHGLIWFLGMLGIVFAGDTLAYLAGYMWGDKKLLPKVSPKKTWEGSIGGLFGSATAGFILSFFLPDINVFALVGLAILTGVIAQMGDLYESMLKRIANVKDSGRLMPGHGGILDRVDGVLFASPIMLLGASILEKVI